MSSAGPALSATQTADAGQGSRSGLVFATGAYLCWGAFPLYWPLLEPAGAAEILAMRILCALLFVGGLILISGRSRGLAALVTDRTSLWRLCGASVAITVNWGVFIWAVNAHHVIETSLGYFINPLLTILLGVFVLGERLRAVQWAAVAIAAIAILVITADYGRLPWIAIVLACSFGSYALLKKQVSGAPLETLAVETSVVALPALIVLSLLAQRSQLSVTHHGVGHALLLLGSGVVTAVPLLLFAAGARRIPLSVIGLIQYLTPVIQLAVGVGIRHEPMNSALLAGFCLVWSALIILIADGARAALRPKSSPTVDAHS